jgi:cytochrome c oxidase cbb3-type subunit 3
MPQQQEDVKSPYQENAWGVGEGKRLYAAFNCAGCHGMNGGGAIGPALMDDKWIYGSTPDTIFATIVDGRPNGMPSFRGRIPEAQVWQLVAYVRSMSGLISPDVAPNRSDGMAGAPPEGRREPTRPDENKPK